MDISISGHSYEISSPTTGAIRVRNPELKYGGLDRYNITHVSADTSLPEFETDGDKLILKNADGKVLTELTTVETPEGWQVSLSLRDGEKLYGLGDINRTRLDRRGYRYRVWVINVKSYIPVPFLMSSEGWAISVNTTYENFFDVGATDKDRLNISCRYGKPDITLFTGRDFAELLYRYTAVSGRTIMLPKWAMGLTFVCNTKADASELIGDGLNFRREDIPCDVLGLEPGWMEKNYDGTTGKQWHHERFYIPSYAQKGPHTFLGAIDRLKFKLSLWLCCDYDLTVFEEKQLGNTVGGAEKASYLNTGGYETNSENVSFEDDEHFHNASKLMDNVTKPDEGWFEHLKKFVDQGVSAFKLDGAWQVIDHPDRLYGNGMIDKEAHNLYPVIYAKQMSLGYSEHTGKRAMIYTAGGYTGIQQYAATWAGDTGGGYGPLVSMLNGGMCGHSNTSCDLDVFSTESIHFGFLQPWSQVNSWNYWRHPWLLEDEDKEIFRYYDKLRYSLVPYFYTAAYQAYATGMPIMRALPLVYPDDDNCYERLSQYMLGDSLLVGVFLDQAEKTDENG
nr:glycoside hydrolase family 31 protein [Clostridia bacterium]